MRYCTILFLELLLIATGTSGLQTNVQVCTNKDCCKRFQGKSMTLVQTVYDLIPPADLDQVTIEPSGCLSNCGKGPNICIQSGEQEVVVNGVLTAASAAAELDLSEQLSTHPTLLAAVNVMEKAELGESSSSFVLHFWNTTAVPSRVAWRNIFTVSYQVLRVANSNVKGKVLWDLFFDRELTARTILDLLQFMLTFCISLLHKQQPQQGKKNYAFSIQSLKS